MMQDMFICLGQEGEKVERLKKALEARGVDAHALLADLEDDGEGTLGEKNVVCDIAYRVVDGNGCFDSQKVLEDSESMARNHGETSPAVSTGEDRACTGHSGEGGCTDSAAPSERLSQTSRRERAAARSLNFSSKSASGPMRDTNTSDVKQETRGDSPKNIDTPAVLGEINVNTNCTAGREQGKKTRRKNRKEKKKKQQDIEATSSNLNKKDPDPEKRKEQNAFNQKKKRTLIVFTAVNGAVNTSRRSL